MKIPNNIQIKKVHDGKGLFAKQAIKKGTIVFRFRGKTGDMLHTNCRSLQIGENRFLESTAKFDDFLNHSCDPNCYIDWNTMNLVTLKNISAGEELSFNYNTSEYDLCKQYGNISFSCLCGSKNCIRYVKGFRHLNFNQKRKIQDFISPFLRFKSISF